MKELVTKAGVLLEALPYLQRYRGEIFVVKYGGSFMDSPDPETRIGVARDIVFLRAAGINPVVVHGGGKAVTRALEGSGAPSRFIDGLRVTDRQSVEIVERVLSREINPEIVTAIKNLGGAAHGFSGTEIFSCKKLAHGTADLGFVGEVTAVDTRKIMQCLGDGLIPVISPTARDDAGNTYNSNADVSAAHAAIALKARRLIFMSDVPGLLRNPADPATLISRLRVGEIAALRQQGVVDKGMIPKVESAAAAITAGVEKVSLVDGRVPHSVLLEIFTTEGVGTEVVQ